MSVDDRNADTDAAEEGATALAMHLKRWGPLVGIVVVMIVGYAQGWHEYVTLSSLIRNRDALVAFIADNMVLALLAYMAVYAAVVALSFPGGSFLTIGGGFLFGWFIAGTTTIVAATAGATAIFLAARTSFGEALRARAGPFMEQLAEGFRKDAASYLLFLRLTPIFPFWLVNLAPALFNVPLRTYVVTTALGIIPGTYAYAVFGSGLDSVIAAQEAANPGCGAAGTCRIDTAAILTTELIVALVALGLVALIPVAMKVLRRPGNNATK